MNLFKKIFSILALILMLAGCKNGLPGADARKIPYDPQERVKRNIEQGKGFRLSNVVKNQGSGNFEFASSNELWRASLDVIDFIPLASANYSGGVIITDWYSENNNSNESVKIIIRFLTNEIRSDALSIKTFYKICNNTSDCRVVEKKGILGKELQKEILKLASQYKDQEINKNFKPYVMSTPGD